MATLDLTIEQEVHVPLFALPTEELADDRSTLFGEHSARDLGLVIQFRVVEDREGGTGGAGLAIACAKDQPLQPRLHDGACTHRARFNCSIQRAAGQAVVPEPARGSPQRENLRVRGRVVEVNRLVVSARDDLPVLNYHSADGNFLLIKTSLSFAQCAPHKQFILAGREVFSPRPNHHAMLARLRGPGGQFVRFRVVVGLRALRGWDSPGIVMPFPVRDILRKESSLP